MKLGEWLGLICLAAALYILWQIRPLLLLLFAAVVIAIALNSLALQVQRLGLSRRAALPIVIIGSMLVGALFGLGIVPPFIEQFSLLIDLVLNGIDTLPSRLEMLAESLPEPLQLPEQLRFPDLSDFFAWLTAPDSAALDVFSNFFSFFNSSLQVLLQLLLVSVLALMLLFNPEAYRSAILRMFPAFYRHRADVIFGQCEVALGNWLGGILISSLFVFALSFLGLSLLGINLVLAHALLAGILNFIPNIGPTLSVAFPMMVALLSPEPWKAIAVFILYLIIQQIEAYLLTPTVMARQVNLLPAFTLAAQIFFASIFGFLGLLLALPLTVVAKIWIQELVIQDILDGWKMSSRRRLLTAPRLPAALPKPDADAKNGPEGNGPEGTSEEI
ncbi:AI-2E family transporter [Romeria aff. gracilis LEGE 07310]|uniref:AI-2E family transporter n=1 Tax=Vasconcelosia minhoensis LEGE 07310 TaxID=915328 RepID=A0A8J7AEN8_9CYAN|nr:AI-2E family transporter [Romeria gracilis]MBE9076018.1 AI-2E family transporter [Romeria aff. gracilis LEGE 07310]